MPKKTAEHDSPPVQMHIGLFNPHVLALERILLSAVEPPFLGKQQLAQDCMYRTTARFE
jgi:hypothetical protein